MRGVFLGMMMLLMADCTAAAQGPLTLGPGDLMIPGPEGVQLRARFVSTEDGRSGIPVLAFHGCGGIGGPDRGIRLPARERDWSDRLHALGHPVLFVDSFGSRGRREACEGGSVGIEAETIRRADAHAAAAWAAAQPWATPGGVVMLGWSHGASTVFGGGIRCASRPDPRSDRLLSGLLPHPTDRRLGAQRAGPDAAGRLR